MAIQALIIEDEPLAADKLERALNRAEHSVEVLAKAKSIQSAVQWLQNNTADLIFCDIHLGDGLSFNIFDQVEVKTPIIFTTAYDQYALQAFKLNSIDYLLKPVSKTDLEKALQKYVELKEPMNPQIDFSALMDAMKGEKEDYQQRFMVYLGERIVTVKSEEIAYFYAEGKYVFLVTSDGKEHIVDYTLDRLTQKLDPTHFFRVNRQFIVTIKGIAEMFTYSKSRVKIELKPEAKKPVIVSGERSSDFKKWLNR